jgi:hypothetical protein
MTVIEENCKSVVKEKESATGRDGVSQKTRRSATRKGCTRLAHMEADGNAEH